MFRGGFLLLSLASLVFADPSLPTVDRRSPPHSITTPLAGERAEAEARLRSRVPGARVDYDLLRGGASYVRALGGTLSGPGGRGRGISLQSVDALPSDEPYKPVKAFLDEHPGLFGHGSDLLAGRAPVRASLLSDGLGQSVAWDQRVDGIPVLEAILIGHLTRGEELLSIASSFVPDAEGLAQAWDPARPALVANPPIPVEEAVRLASEAIEEPVPAGLLLPLDPDPVGLDRRQRFRVGLLPGEGVARLTWVPMAREQLSLCWRVELTRSRGGERYEVLVDVRNGEILLRRCLTLYAAEASYLVFTGDSPAPLRPTLPDPSSNQPPVVERTLLTLASLNPVASPLGWIGDGENETRGNNVDAHLDLDGDDYPDLPRPHGSPFRVFAPPFDPARPAAENGEAAVVQLFYWCNVMHDRLYELGFTESAGNFQKDNFGRGGIGGDPVLADAQDGSGVNNANFTPSPDGEPGRIQMYVFDGMDPTRDGDLDAGIILHEYAHGLSTRLVGGGVGISSLQAGGMGEGWSDFYALSMLTRPGEDPDACYALGSYVTEGFFGLQENAYYGIRRYPYSTDLSKNPLTFQDIDPARISPHTGVPRSPVFPFAPGLAGEVHNQGEVWCATLWDARSRLIKKHGVDPGNRLMLQLVTDGMKLSPPNPTFLQARDAILQADVASTGGANQGELWAAFARRGMGFSALCPATTSTSGVVEAFDLPDDLGLLGELRFLFPGAVGGPLFVDCQSITLTNRGTNLVTWGGGVSQGWLRVEPVAGTLAPGEAVDLRLCVAPEAAALGRGRFMDSLQITNTLSGVVQRRGIELRLSEFTSMPFADDFESGPLQKGWFVSNPPWGRVQLTSLGGPHGGKRHMTLDSDSDGLPTRNEVTLGLDLRGWTNVVLRFWAKGFSDEPNAPPPSPFRDGADFDGVAVSADGLFWHEAQSLRHLGSTNREFVVSLDDVVVPAGLAYGAHFQIRFNQFDNYPIPVDGIAVDDVRVTGNPVGRFRLEAPPPIREGSRVAGTGQLVLAVPARRDVEFLLTTPAAGQIDLPSRVLVRAGEARGLFPIVALDNTLLDGTRWIPIHASAEGYVDAEIRVEVDDDETATLTLTTVAAVSEGDGLIQRGGRIELDTQVASDFAIELASSDPDRLEVPGSVTIPAGARSVNFDLSVVDGSSIDGPLLVTVSASVPGWQGVSAGILVSDNEVPALDLQLPAALAEGAPHLTGLITLSGTLPTNLVVSLLPDDASRLTLPAEVTVEAGTLSALFDIAATDNPWIEGERRVGVTAGAPGFLSGGASVRLIDDETPAPPYDPAPADGATGLPSDVLLQWKPGFGDVIRNGGFEEGSLGGWSYASESSQGFVVSDGSVNPDGPELPLPPYSGGYYAVLAQDRPGKHQLWQDVVIPRDALGVTLSWVDFIHNHGPEFFDPSQRYRVEIQDPSGELLRVAYTTRPGDPLSMEWTRHAVDLSEYRGRVVRILFAEEDELGFVNVGVDEVSLKLGASGETRFEVYLGSAGPSGPFSRVADPALPQAWVGGLEAATEYWWQVVAVKGAARTPSPVWSFTTREVGPVDHFEWGRLPATVTAGEGVSGLVTALDDAGFVVPSFDGPLPVSGHAGSPGQGTLLLSEIFLSGTNWVECSNLSGAPIDVSGWSLVFYDRRSWPAPKTTFLLPSNSVVAPGGTFTVIEGGRPPGRFPAFALGVSLDWGVLPVGVPTAVLLLDGSSHVMDFACAIDADPSLITSPVPIPPEAWSGAAIPSTQVLGRTWQRVGTCDLNSNQDWVLGAASFGALNEGLAPVFTPPGRFAVSPAALGPFQQGRWAGGLDLGGAAGLVTLVADDGQGHVGYSPPITLLAPGDLSLSLTRKPTRTFLQQPFTLEYRIVNSGPSSATGVVLVDQLPPEATVLSATSTGGACVVTSTGIRCPLDPIPPGGAGVVVTLRLVIDVPGTYVSDCALESPLPDPFPANNRRQDAWDVEQPFLVVRDASVAEGNSGTNVASFRVTLSAPLSREVRVDYATQDAGATAGLDYLAVQGTLVFAPGVTNLTIKVPVLGDTTYDPIEAFLVNLSNPRNAVILDGVARGSIQEDDLPPRIVVEDVSVTEGGPGDGVVAVVPVRLTNPVSDVVLLSYYTLPGSALAVSDYVESRGLLRFAPGVTQLLVRVPIVGDLRAEPDETFSLVVTNVVGAEVQKAAGSILVRDDDAMQLQAIVWSAPQPTQELARPFPATLTAVDQAGRGVPGYGGALRVEVVREAAETETPPGTNSWEFPFRTYFHDARSQFLYPASEIGAAGRISSIAFQVDSLPGQAMGGFRLRLMQTAALAFDSRDWETSGWTTVYEGLLEVSDPGWVRIPFSEPFAYDGQRSLALDLSFSNPFYTADGLCRYVETEGLRARVFESDGAFGDPRLWGGSTPPPRMTNRVPVLRLAAETPVAAEVAGRGVFQNGTWSGTLRVLEPRAGLRLRAWTGDGLEALSDPFTVVDAGADPGAPVIVGIGLRGQDVLLTFRGVADRLYQLEASDQLADRAWSAVGPPVDGSPAGAVVADPGGAPHPQRYYRIRGL